MTEQDKSGYIKNLPEGWIDGTVAYARLRKLLIDTVGEGDPAPWHDPVNPEYWGPHMGRTPDEYTRSEKFITRLIATFQNALTSGRLPASIYNGADFRLLPKSAFRSAPKLQNALWSGPFLLDPYWPDEWQRWSGHGWAIPFADFDGWLASGEALSTAELPPRLTDDEPPEVALLDRRLPTESERIPLSEAVTWMAFGIALDAERLDRAIDWQRLCGGDLQDAQRGIEQAAASLLRAGADRRVSFYGRHVESHGHSGQRTETISPLTLDDYRQLEIFGHDSLYYGQGLKRWYRTPHDSASNGSERSDHYVNVTVHRAELLRQFQPGSDQAPAVPPSANDTPITWDDFPAHCRTELQRLNDAAQRDEWWTWPEAIAWVGSRNAGNIATLRYWGQEWRGDGDRRIVIGAQALMADQYCDSPRRSEADLLSAIQRGAVATSGRADRDARSAPLGKDDWRGGMVVYPDGVAALVSAGDKMTVWAFDIAVGRADLMREFHSTVVSVAPGGTVPPNRKLDHGKIKARVTEMREGQPMLSRGSAAASIVAELGNNPRTGKPWDYRHIERIIAPLWEGGLS